MFCLFKLSTCLNELWVNNCHTPILGLTRMGNPNRVRDARLYTGTLIDLFFLKAELVPMGIKTIYVITQTFT